MSQPKLTSLSILLILVLQLERSRPTRPILPTKGRHVQQLVGDQQTIHAPRVRGIRVVHLAVLAKKHAQSRLLSRDVPLLPLGLELCGRGKIVLDRRDRRVQRRVEVVVKVGALAGNPGKGPADLLLPSIQLGEGGAGDDDQRGVARAQVANVGNVLA